MKFTNEIVITSQSFNKSEGMSQKSGMEGTISIENIDNEKYSDKSYSLSEHSKKQASKKIVIIEDL